MSLLDKLKTNSPDNTLSLLGNGFNPQKGNPAFGYADSTNSLNPKLSRLQFTYSVDYIPTVRIKDFNKSQYPSVLPPASILDELDTKAPNLEVKGVVSKVYKSKQGRNYRDLGPAEGRY
jgi:hypothetical protein